MASIDVPTDPARKTWDVICVGTAMVDILFVDLPRVPRIGEDLRTARHFIDVGGGGAITAIALARLGRATALATDLGDDLLGNFLRDVLAEEGIDINCCRIHSDKPTAVSLEMSFPADRATVTSWPFERGWDIGDVEHVERRLPSARHLHVFDLNDAVLPLLKSAVQAHLTTSVDVNLNREHVERVFGLASPYIDFLIPNRKQVSTVGRDLEATAVALGRAVRKACVIKMGADGAICSDGESVFRVSTFPVNVADTTGAGDAFDAGFLSAFFRGAGLETCTIVGNATAALSVQALGGTRGLPRLDRLKAFLAQAGFRALIAWD